MRRPGGGTAPIASLSLWELLNLGNTDTLDLWDRLWQSAPRPDVQRALANHSLADIGYQEYSRRLPLGLASSRLLPRICVAQPALQLSAG